MKPRVLMVDFVTTFGGVQRVMANLLPALAPYVEMYGLDALEEPVTQRVFTECGVRLIKLPIKPRIRALGFQRSWSYKLLLLICLGPVYGWYICRLVYLMGSNRFEALYTNSKKSLIISAVAAKLTKVPLIYHAHGFNHHTDIGVIYRMAINSASAVIAVSKDVRDKLILAGVSPHKVRVIFNAVQPTSSPKIVPASAEPSHSLQCLLASNIQPGKGIHVAIEAVALLRERGIDVNLRIAGAVPTGVDADYLHKLKRMVEQFHLDCHVEFLGWRDDVPKLMDQCDVTVLPSIIAESFGMVLAEAMSLGRPVVASNIGGIPEVVADGETGYLVAAGSSQELADKLAKLAGDPLLRLRLGENARTWVRRRFSLERQAVEVGTLIQQVVTGQAV